MKIFFQIANTKGSEKRAERGEKGVCMCVCVGLSAFLISLSQSAKDRL